MKVAIIGTRGYPYVYGGFETFVKELGERLVKKDIEVHVYCQAGLFKERPAILNGILLHYIPTIKTKSLNQIVHSFLSIIHATFSQVDIIFVLNLAAGPMGWIPKITGKKTMINTDGLEWERPKWRGLGTKYFYFGAWCATKFYDVLVSDAEAMRQVYLQKFKAESEMIAYGAPQFKERDSKALAKFNLKPYSYYLIVGRLIPDNNADFMIKEFLKSNSPKKLVVVGDVPYQDDYANSLKSLASDQLIFTGYVKNQDDLLSLYQHCFVYLHGHEFGGTNPAMLKAMANQCAILALNTRFNQEMLNNGEFGLFFDKKEKSLITKMNEIEQSPVLVENLRKQVNNGLGDKYNWEFVSGQYINLMNKLLWRNSL